jgi:hypothetical protein
MHNYLCSFTQCRFTDMTNVSEELAISIYIGASAIVVRIKGSACTEVRATGTLDTSV